jgi:hypothetical protein
VGGDLEPAPNPLHPFSGCEPPDCQVQGPELGTPFQCRLGCSFLSLSCFLHTSVQECWVPWDCPQGVLCAATVCTPRILPTTSSSKTSAWSLLTGNMGHQRSSPGHTVWHSVQGHPLLKQHTCWWPEAESSEPPCASVSSHKWEDFKMLLIASLQAGSRESGDC